MYAKTIGFNTAGIKNKENFFALLLKIKFDSNECRSFYFQHQTLVDLLLILKNRMKSVINKINNTGGKYQHEIINACKSLQDNSPAVDLIELEQPDSLRRVMTVTLKKGMNNSTLIFTMQDGDINVISIDDLHVEAMIVAIDHALKVVGDNKFIEYLSSTIDFLLLYVVDLTNTKSLDYKQFSHEEWKLNMYQSYRSILFSSKTDDGERILTGAVIKTGAELSLEEESVIYNNVANKVSRLNTDHNEYPLYQVFNRIIPASYGKILTIEECLRPLHAFYLETQALLKN